MEMKRKGQIYASICALILCLTACGSSTQPIEPTASSTAQIEEAAITYFKPDKGLNRFFTNYNQLAEYPFEPEQIRQGNVRTKALVSTGDLYVELVNSQNGLDILIDDGPEESEALYSVFRDFLKVMDDSLSDEQIEQAWIDIKEIGTRYLYDGSYTLNKLRMNYSDVEFQGTRQVKVNIYGPQYSV